MENNTKVSLEFSKLLSNVHNIIEKHINTPMILPFSKIMEINPELRFVIVKFISKKYKLISNGQESNTIRVLTNCPGNICVYAYTDKSESPNLHVVREDNDMKPYIFIFDSYNVKDDSIFIQDRDFLLDYRDIGQSSFILDSRFKQMFNTMIQSKRDELWSIINNNINKLMSMATTSHEALKVSEIVLRLSHIKWSI